MDQFILTKNNAINDVNNSLLGSGLSFPLKTNGRGGLQMASGSVKLRQSCMDIIENIPPEIIYHERDGVGIETYLSRNATQATADIIAKKAYDELMRLENRIATLEVVGSIRNSGTTDHEEEILLDVQYTDITYAHTDNFTLPYRLGEKI